MYKVYIHITPNKKMYIGITKNNLNRRWMQGLGYRTQIFYRAILKYGWNNIQHILLFDNLSYKEAKEKEIQLISFFNTNNSRYGYNITKGGDYRKTPTLETRLKISNSLNKREKRNNYIISAKEHRHKKGKPVICIETKMIFQRIKDASIYYKICDETIRKCCNKQRFTAGGYHWEFYKDGDL